MLGMKQKFISNLPAVRVGAFLWYKAMGLCISGALVEVKDVSVSEVYNENINWWVFCKTWVSASAFSLVAINCLASLNLPQTNFYIKNRNLKTCTLQSLNDGCSMDSAVRQYLQFLFSFPRPAYLFKLVGNCFTMSCWFLPSTMWISHKYTCVPSLLSFPPTPHTIPALYLRFLPCKLDKLLGQVSSSLCLLLFPFPFWWMRILFSLWSVGRLNGESSHSVYNPGENTC